MEGERPTIELYVRSLRPNAAAELVDDAISRLQALDEEGVIETVDIKVWGRQLPLDGPVAETETARSIRQTLRDIESWAATAGVDVTSQFDTRVVERNYAGPSSRARTLPTCCLVERIEGDVRTAVPHRRDGEARTIADRLDYLEATMGVDATPTESDPSAIAD